MKALMNYVKEVYPVCSDSFDYLTIVLMFLFFTFGYLIISRSKVSNLSQVERVKIASLTGQNEDEINIDFRTTRIDELMKEKFFFILEN
jgi:hypothetical protein